MAKPSQSTTHMEHLHTFIQSFTSSFEAQQSKSVLAAVCISFISATLAFITSWQHVQIAFAIAASCVAMVSGGFAIYYYKLQIKKFKDNA